jgi:hypothetical protein
MEDGRPRPSFEFPKTLPSLAQPGRGSARISANLSCLGLTWRADFREPRFWTITI